MAQIVDSIEDTDTGAGSEQEPAAPAADNIDIPAPVSDPSSLSLHPSDEELHDLKEKALSGDPEVFEEVEVKEDGVPRETEEQPRDERGRFIKVKVGQREYEMEEGASEAIEYRERAIQSGRDKEFAAKEREVAELRGELNAIRGMLERGGVGGVSGVGVNGSPDGGVEDNFENFSKKTAEELRVEGFDKILTRTVEEAERRAYERARGELGGQIEELRAGLGAINAQSFPTRARGYLESQVMGDGFLADDGERNAVATLWVDLARQLLGSGQFTQSDIERERDAIYDRARLLYLNHARNSGRIESGGGSGAGDELGAATAASGGASGSRLKPGGSAGMQSRRFQGGGGRPLSSGSGSAPSPGSLEALLRAK